MKKLLALAASMILSAGIAAAIPSGTYEFVGDGATGEARVNGDQFEMGFGGQGCVGGVDGTLQPSANNFVIYKDIGGGDICKITISPFEDGYYVDGGPGCTYFSGAMCSMTGSLTPISVAKAAPRSDTAVLAASFKNQSDDFRKRMQTTLANEGHYKGAIDGAYGPGTEAAIKASAAASGIDVTTNDGVAKILGKLLSGR